MKKKQREMQAENISPEEEKQCHPSSIRLGDELTDMVNEEIRKYRRMTGGNISMSEYVRRSVSLYLKLPASVRDRLLELSDELRTEGLEIGQVLCSIDDTSSSYSCLSKQLTGKTLDDVKSLCRLIRQHHVSGAVDGRKK